MTKIAIL